eukprot:350136-Chlamydomonas_euryale.AAC.25
MYRCPTHAPCAACRMRGWPLDEAALKIGGSCTLMTPGGFAVTCNTGAVLHAKMIRWHGWRER